MVLERVSSSPQYNYSITRRPWAFQPLLNILQMDKGLFREKLAIDSGRQGLGEVSGETLAPGIETDSGTFRCHRGRLEKLSEEGQDSRWEHMVQGVTTTSQGNVVQLKDAKPLDAKVLIGTDGVHSQIRKSSVPKIELKVLSFVVINGKGKITKAEFQDHFASRSWFRSMRSMRTT